MYVLKLYSIISNVEESTLNDLNLLKYWEVCF